MYEEFAADYLSRGRLAGLEHDAIKIQCRSEVARYQAAQSVAYARRLQAVCRAQWQRARRWLVEPAPAGHAAH